MRKCMTILPGEKNGRNNKASDCITEVAIRGFPL